MNLCLLFTFINSTVLFTLVVILLVLNIILVIWYFIVIKKFKKKSSMFNKKNEQIKTELKLRSKYLSSISHDLRAPLNSIIGFSEIILNNEKDEIEVKEYIENIHDASKHLLDLANSLLDVSKFESGKMILKSDIIDLNSIILEVSNLFNINTINKKIKFIVSNKLTKNKYIGDKLRLKQILINLLSNSFKYTSEGFIELLVQNKNEDVVFKIIDSGKGMSKEYIDNLFEPYKREIDNNTIKNGVGLGLCIVKKIVDLMNGNIKVLSEVGKGSTFIVSIPLVETNNVIIKSSEVLNLKKLNDVPYKSKKILIVDDSSTNRLVTKLLLERLGINVVEAFNGFDAISILKNASNNYFDLIIMDLRMPDIDGYESSKMIRELRDDLKLIPIIAMSADIFDYENKKAVEYGINDHISKPIEIEVVYEVLNKWLK